MHQVGRIGPNLARPMDSRDTLSDGTVTMGADAG